jgi:endonuclease-3 related protein
LQQNVIMDLQRLLELLRGTYDVHDWWPAESPFEVMVGAILVQQTNWATVEKVLGRLRSEGLLDVGQLASCDLAKLESIVRPAGFFRQKAKRIKDLAGHIRDRHGSDPMTLLGGPTDTVRTELMSLHGIGRETADSILVFGAGKEKFVAAAYSVRVLNRTGVFRSDGYDEIQSYVESNLKGGQKAFHDLYALMVQLCQDTCLAVPNCEGCSLRMECEYPTASGIRGCSR